MTLARRVSLTRSIDDSGRRQTFLRDSLDSLSHLTDRRFACWRNYRRMLVTPDIATARSSSGPAHHAFDEDLYMVYEGHH